MEGEERLAKMEGIIEQMDKRLNHIETTISDMHKEFVGKFDDMHKEFTGKFDDMHKEFTGKFDGMHKEFTGKFDGMHREFTGKFDDLRKEITTNFRWTIGIIITMWITIILAVMIG